MAKVALKNTARGDRGVRNAAGDLIMVAPGQTVTGDFDANEVKDALAGDFEKGKASDAADDGDEAAALGERGPGDPPVPEDPPANEGAAPAAAPRRRS